MNLTKRLSEFTRCQTTQEVKDTVRTFAGNYYTYIICRIQSRGTKHKLVPIYVGKGRGHRCLHHNGIGGKLEFEDELFYFLRPAKSESFALELEEALIEYFGRPADGGSLVNILSFSRVKCSKDTKTTADFIKEANLVHKGRYDYTKSFYSGCTGKVEIICKEHGSFWQNA